MGIFVCIRIQEAYINSYWSSYITGILIYIYYLVNIILIVARIPYEEYLYA